MRKPSAHAQVLQLIHILRIEDQARMCTSREEARALIGKAISPSAPSGAVPNSITAAEALLQQR